MNFARHYSCLLLGLLLASSAPAFAQKGAATPQAAIAALAASPPRYLAELEAIAGDLRRDPAQWEQAVGPLDRVGSTPFLSRVKVELAIDVFHQDPRQVADPLLASYRLDFASGREEARRLLAAAGPRLELSHAGNRVWRYGDFYYSERPAPGAFSLSWFAREPAFAIPERSAAQDAQLLDKLVAVAAAQFSRAAVEKEFGKLLPAPRSAGGILHDPTWVLEYSPRDAEYPQEFSLTLKRPLPAAELARRLGMRAPVVAATGSHLASRELSESLPRAEAYREAERNAAAAAPAGARTFRVQIEVGDPGPVRSDGPERSWWSADGAGVLSLRAYPTRPIAGRPLVFQGEILPELEPADPAKARLEKVTDRPVAAILTPEGRIPAPRRIHDVRPRYTESAHRAGIEGPVILELTLALDGRVSEARVLRGLPFGLDRQAREAALQWRYEPFVVAGRAIETYLTVTLDFTLVSSPRR